MRAVHRGRLLSKDSHADDFSARHGLLEDGSNTREERGAAAHHEDRVQILRAVAALDQRGAHLAHDLEAGDHPLETRGPNFAQHSASGGK